MEKVIDLSGLECPEPIMMLRAFFRKCSAGDLVRVTATDPATQRDIPDFCRFMDHELKEKGTEKPFVYLIKVGNT